MFGNLLCLSVSGSFRDPIWATVVVRDVKLLTSKNIILIELCSESNDISDCDAIIKLSLGSGNITVVESPTYYRAYQPVLKALHEMQPENFPFKSQLVDANAEKTASEYFISTTAADTTILRDRRSHRAEPLQRVIGKHPEDSTLDISQYDALCEAVSCSVAIIQCPPSTGKTFIGIKLLELILSMSTSSEAPIIVLIYKNHVFG